MMLWNEMRLLHENLPAPVLRLLGSSEKSNSFFKYLAYGGRKYTGFYKMLESMQEWSIDRIYEFQLERLKKLLNHAYDNVPYYRRMFDTQGLKPSDIKCLEDLQKIPVITKDDILTNYNQFFAKNLWYKRRMYRYTSGTSGKALKVCLDDASIAAVCATGMYFNQNFLKRMPGEAILNSPPSQMTVYLFHHNMKSLQNEKPYFYSPIMKMVFFLGHLDSGEEFFKSYVHLIKKFNIKHIIGFPSVFFAFAKYLTNENEYVKIKTASLVGEVLYNFQRRFIEKQLGCKIFNRYAQSEVTTVACECSEHHGMHASPILGVTEVKNAGLEGKGEIVMTNLCNYTWPIIRYSTKDVITLSQHKKCPCGCSFPRLMNIEGRDNDIILIPGGGCLFPIAIVRLTIIISGIKDLYVFQNEDYSLDVSVVKEENSDGNKVRDSLEQRLKLMSKNKLKIRIAFKDYIKRKSNKYRVAETRLPFENVLRTDKKR